MALKFHRHIEALTLLPGIDESFVRIPGVLYWFSTWSYLTSRVTLFIILNVMWLASQTIYGIADAKTGKRLEITT